MFLNIPNLEEFRLRYVLYYRHISFQLSTKAWSLLGPLIFIVNPFVLVTRPFSVVELRVQYVTTCCPRCKALFRRRAKRMSSPVVFVASTSSGTEPRGGHHMDVVFVARTSSGVWAVWRNYVCVRISEEKKTDRLRICFLTFFLFSLPVVGTSHNFFCSIIQGVFSKLLSASFYYKFFPPNFWKKIITLPQQRLI